MEDEKLERERLAIETKLKRADQAIAQKQLALAEAQFAWQKEQAKGWGRRLSPTGAVMVGAAAGLIGTAVAKWFDYAVAEPLQPQTAIILKAIDVPSGQTLDAQDKQQARNLLWFVEAGYIKLPDAVMKQLRMTSGIPDGHPLPLPRMSPPSESASKCSNRP
jgi:hypothetical protein